MRKHYRYDQLISERELFTGQEPQGFRDLLRGIKPISLHEKARVRGIVMFTVERIEEELKPYGGLQTLRIRRHCDSIPVIWFSGDNI